MSPKAPHTKELVPYLVFLKCGRNSKRQDLVQGSSSTGYVPFGDGEVLLFLLSLAQFSAMRKMVLLHKHPTPNVPLRPKTMELVMSDNVTMKPVTLSLRL